MSEAIHRLRALREQRAKLVADARVEYDKIGKGTSEGDAAEIEQRFDTMMAEADRLKSRIDREERLLDNERDMVAVIERRAGREDEREQRQNIERNPIARQEYRAAFSAYLRGGFEGINSEQRALVQMGYQVEQRAQDTATGSAGGYLVPVQYQAELEIALKAYGGVMDAARILPTSAGGTLQWPKIDDTATKAVIIGTNTAPAERALTFGQATLNDYTYESGQVLVPFQLMQDSAIDIGSLVIEMMGIRFGRGLNYDFTLGTGSGQPQGVTLAANGATAAAAAAIATDDLVNLEHSVDPLYRKMGARWMFADSTLKALKKLKDTMGRPLWAPGIIVGAPDELMGYGYTINQDMAAIATGQKTVLFGAFQKYIVRSVRDPMILRLNERNMDKGQITYVGFARYDGRYVDAGGAVKHLVHP